jgi:hypothetical protein
LGPGCILQCTKNTDIDIKYKLARNRDLVQLNFDIGINSPIPIDKPTGHNFVDNWRQLGSDVLLLLICLYVYYFCCLKNIGEVTSSAIVSVSRPAAPNGLGAPRLSRPVPPMKTELPPMYLFEKGKSTAEEPVVVSLEEEGEDEAEAAASAVAVAAISNDEVAVGTVVDSSVPVEQKNICSADAPGSTSGQDSVTLRF